MGRLTSVLSGDVYALVVASIHDPLDRVLYVSQQLDERVLVEVLGQHTRAQLRGEAEAVAIIAPAVVRSRGHIDVHQDVLRERLIEIVAGVRRHLTVHHGGVFDHAVHRGRWARRVWLW
jgi:hypothetical protein